MEHVHNGRPGDVRNFVHKRIIGAIAGGVSGIIKGGPLGGIAGAFGGFAGGGKATPVTFGPGGPQGCPAGFFRNPTTLQCQPLAPRATGVNLPFAGPPGAGVPVPGGGRVGFGEQQFGDAVMGRYGAALEPGARGGETLVCPRGTVLGLDELCYNKRDLKNDERKWPRGRRPLLTGGEMRCISIASAAAKKLQRKEKQLQDMGMLKKHTPTRRRALPSGHHHHSSHD